MTAAVAVWVKTPGLSPVKTRLAASIGTAAAEAFYRLSVDAVRAVVRVAAERTPGRWTPYWAVAEPEAAGWEHFATVQQGAGGLGERLSRVYDALLRRHRPVVFIGADAPQITVDHLAAALDAAADGRFVLGPADDGGFYLFAGSLPIPPAAWTSVPYSAADTLRALEARLRPLGALARLPPLFDVDTALEMERLRRTMATQPRLLPEQLALLGWLAEHPLHPER